LCFEILCFKRDIHINEVKPDGSSDFISRKSGGSASKIGRPNGDHHKNKIITGCFNSELILSQSVSSLSIISMKRGMNNKRKVQLKKKANNLGDLGKEVWKCRLIFRESQNKVVSTTAESLTSLTKSNRNLKSEWTKAERCHFDKQIAREFEK